MKFLRLLLFILTTGILFTSCQKEFSAETGSAQGTLVKDAANNCTAAVNGAYKKDTLITAANYVDVQVDFAQVGIYIINTDTVNGYYFRAAGAAAVTGLNTVRLFGTGKPIAVGTDIFKVHYGTSICEFSTNVTIGTGGGGTTTAVFTFPNAAACTGAVQTPNFFVGIPTIAAVNTITLFVNVTQAGTYTLTTTPANGLTFMGSGTLAVGNNQPIVLGASGTPASPAGTINYTFSTTTPVASSCGFGLTVQAAPTPAAYTFNCGTASFLGTYQVGTAMTSGNTITVPITVGTPGGYALTTTVNGVTFGAAGILTATTTSITLNATGTPTAAAAPSTTFVLSGGGGANCSVTIPFTAAPAAAVYTFTCGAASFAGTYQVGTAMTTGNTLTVPITVTTPGSYNITTTVNGVTFSGSGNLTATSPSITLNATGTPAAAAAPSTVFVLSGGGGANCSVTIPFTTGGGGGTDFLKAKINGSATFTNFTLNLDAILTTSPSSLEISGDAFSGETFLLGLDRVLPPAITTNVLYNINDFLTGTVITVDYEDPTLVLYNTTPINIVTADPFKITITSITATRIEGTFSGSLEEDTPIGPTPLIKKFTEGSFSLSLP